MLLPFKTAVPTALLLASSSIMVATQSVADETTPPSPVAPATVPVAPNAPTSDIDPQAMALLKQSMDAYQKLQAYSDVTASRFVAPQDPNGASNHAKIAWQKPNKFRYDLTSPNPDGKPIHTFAISNGTAYWKQLSKDQQHYYRTPADPNTKMQADEDAMVGQMMSANTMVTPPGCFTLLNNDTPNPRKPKLIQMKVGDPSTADGVPVDVITATDLATNGTKEYHLAFTLSLGKTDHLIRSFVMEESLVGTPPTVLGRLEETHTNVQTPTTLPASTFAFTPPVGLKPGTAKQLADLTADSEVYYDKRLVAGAKPFPFKAVDLEGKSVDLAQYHGKVVVLDFWATWCGPCVGEIPNVIAAYNKHHSQGLEIVGISLDNEKSDLTNFIKENKVPYRQVFDGKGWKSAVATQYKVQAIPFMLVLNKDGSIAAVNARGPQLENAIAKALATK